MEIKEAEIKEAIEELQKDIDWASQKRYPYITTRRVEAVRLAIKALQYIETKGGDKGWIVI